MIEYNDLIEFVKTIQILLKIDTGNPANKYRLKIYDEAIKSMTSEISSEAEENIDEYLNFIEDKISNSVYEKLIQFKENEMFEYEGVVIINDGQVDNNKDLNKLFKNIKN